MQDVEQVNRFCSEKLVDQLVLKYIHIDNNGGVHSELDPHVMIQSAYVQNQAASNGYYWIHLNACHNLVNDWLKEHFAIDQIWIDALLEQESKPRFASVNEREFFLNLKIANDFCSEQTREISSLKFYVAQNYIITTEHTPLYIVHKLYDVMQSPPSDAASFLLYLFDQITNLTENILCDINDHMDQLEEQVLIEHDKDFREQVITIRLKMIVYKRYITSNIDAFAHLRNSSNAHKIEHENFIQELAEITHRFSHFSEEISSIKERAQVIHEELNNHLTERLASITAKLTAVSTVVLPISCITGLFGVNLAGIPGADHHWAFTIFSFGLFIVLIVQTLLFRFFKWF